MAKVMFSAEMQLFTSGTTEIEIAAASYREAIDALVQHFPDLTRELIGRYSVSIDDLFIQNPLLEPLKPDSELYFIPKLAGG